MRIFSDNEFTPFILGFSHRFRRHRALRIRGVAQ